MSRSPTKSSPRKTRWNFSSKQKHRPDFADVQWFQPCIRLTASPAGNQSNYVARSFIYTARGLTLLTQAQHTEEALYRGGQVYVPRGINTNDVNPRPISAEIPVNALIGCFSADNRHLFANAWDHPQELFQGVIVCLPTTPHRRSEAGRS